MIVWRKISLKISPQKSKFKKIFIPVFDSEQEAPGNEFERPGILRHTLHGLYSLQSVANGHKFNKKYQIWRFHYAIALLMI